MSDIHIRTDGRAGRITLTRPKALNAVTWEMIRAIDAALATWADDASIALVIIDAEGDRAFAAGGDIVDLYRTGTAGDYDYGRRFWAEEYRLNARIADYAKPYVALMHGFVMGGGVGISCHGSHRIVDDAVQIAMPECGIGLIPDVGGSRLLANAPGCLGELIGLTGYRMGPGDAIRAGFADLCISRTDWADLIAELCATGDTDAIAARAPSTAPDSPLDAAPHMSQWFGGARMPDILSDLAQLGLQDADRLIATLRRQSPLSVACALSAIRAARSMSLHEALAQEYRFVWRCMSQGDFLEGIRARVIDKDRTPKWRHDSIEAVTDADVQAMLAPLGDDELILGS